MSDADWIRWLMVKVVSSCDYPDGMIEQVNDIIDRVEGAATLRARHEKLREGLLNLPRTKVLSLRSNTEHEYIRAADVDALLEDE